jgi:dUTP pyrophosphatase
MTSAEGRVRVADAEPAGGIVAVVGESMNPRTSIVESRLPARFGCVTVRSLTVVIRPDAPNLMKARFTILDPQVGTPSRAHIGDAAVDLQTRVDVSLLPGERKAVPTGLAVAMPAGHAGLVLPRSGHARRAGIGVVNGPGLIDAGYRGEIEVLLVNHGEGRVDFAAGDRIAQLLVIAVPDIVWEQVDGLDETSRGEAGFGSTGS